MRNLARIAAAAFSLASAQASQAEVHFGSNVHIGGHDVSHQTFNRHRHGEFHIYDKQPRRAGCIWRGNVDGSRTKVCRFKNWR